MADLFKMAVILAAAVAAISAEECNCSEESLSKESTALWDFLSKDNSLNVLPGELSPLVPCSSCLENNRKKRRIAGDAEERGKEERGREERSPTFFRVWQHANDARNKCPAGYRRFLIKCIPYRY